MTKDSNKTVFGLPRSEKAPSGKKSAFYGWLGAILGTHKLAQYLKVGNIGQRGVRVGETDTSSPRCRAQRSSVPASRRCRALLDVQNRGTHTHTHTHTQTPSARACTHTSTCTQTGPHTRTSTCTCVHTQNKTLTSHTFTHLGSTKLECCDCNYTIPFVSSFYSLSRLCFSTPSRSQIVRVR